MRKIKAPVKKIERITHDVYRLCVTSLFLAKKASPGQFVHINVGPSVFLRRPFSVHKVSKSDVYILFRIKGRGTLALSQFKKGDTLDMLGPLGKGFNYRKALKSYDRIILLGGGMGVAPLMFLAEKIKKYVKRAFPKNAVLLGAKTKNEILCERGFKKLGMDVGVATEDGSKGFKGMVVELLKEELKKNNGIRTKIYVCGPREMFRALAEALKKYPRTECEVSYEQFMGCGMGICLGCAIRSKQGYRRVCKDGPVFNIKDIY